MNRVNHGEKEDALFEEDRRKGDRLIGELLIANRKVCCWKSNCCVFVFDLCNIRSGVRGSEAHSYLRVARPFDQRVRYREVIS